MYTYCAPIMSIRKNSNGTMFDPNVLNDIVENQPNVPIRINFSGSPIGSTLSFNMREDGTVMASFDIKYPDMDQLTLFVVPGGRCNTRDILSLEDGTTIISKMELVELSLTSVPADEGLTAIIAID